MKTRLGIVAAVPALLLSSTFFLAAQAVAQQRPPRMEGRAFAGLGPGARFPGGLRLGMLDLSDAQKEQINALRAAHRAAMEPHRNQLRDSAKALRDATANGQFDEAQIRAIAQTQAQANVELTVAAERLKAEIYNILTPEQRAKLEERRARMESRIRERRKPGGE